MADRVADFGRFKVDMSKQYGEGGYGRTFKAVDTSTNEPLAVKRINTHKMRKDAILKECQILEVLNHASIISVKNHGYGDGDRSKEQDGHYYFIFMELAGGGELFDQVIDRGANAMNEKVAREFFNQMVDGMAYCHLAGVAHRDLKLENVLLHEKGQVKIIDFGLSHVYPRAADGNVDRTTLLRDVCGSKSYAAPEVLGGTGYDGYAADMWSLGVCLFAMLSGFFPLDEASRNDWRYPKLAQAQLSRKSTTAVVYSWYKRSTGHLSREVVHLLNGLLTIDPRQRLTMGDLRTHPWVLNTTFAASAGADQGTFNMSDTVGEEGMLYRGFNGNMDFAPTDAMMDDDEPVYRSLGMEEEDAADEAEPAPMPSLGRQRAFSIYKIA